MGRLPGASSCANVYFEEYEQKGCSMTMETAALIGMGIIALFSFAALGLAIWASRHSGARPKNATSSH